MPAELTRLEYGKSRVRLTKLERGPEGDRVRELAVTLLLQGDFGDAYRSGDNRNLIATDSMKNIVNVLAHREALSGIEAFGRRVTDHFLETYPQVDHVRVEIEELTWKPLQTPSGPRRDAFTRAGVGIWSAVVKARRGEAPRVSAGIRDVGMLRTTGSSFAGFVRDEFTTLKETESRALAAEMTAEWRYTALPAESDVSRQAILDALLSIFAQHESRSLQHTLDAMGRAALAKCDEIDRIRLSLENRHLVPFDASAFGSEGEGAVLTPIDEPTGRITGELRRTG